LHPHREMGGRRFSAARYLFHTATSASAEFVQQRARPRAATSARRHVSAAHLVVRAHREKAHAQLGRELRVRTPRQRHATSAPHQQHATSAPPQLGRGLGAGEDTSGMHVASASVRASANAGERVPKGHRTKLGHLAMSLQRGLWAGARHGNERPRVTGCHLTFTSASTRISSGSCSPARANCGDTVSIGSFSP
jgi:hypothetical protein